MSTIEKALDKLGAMNQAAVEQPNTVEAAAQAAQHQAAEVASAASVTDTPAEAAAPAPTAGPAVPRSSTAATPSPG